MIRIVLYQNTNQKIAEADGKWFPRVVSDEPIGLEERAAHMASPPLVCQKTWLTS